MKKLQMKYRILGMFIAVALCASLAACNSANESSVPKETSGETETSKSDEIVRPQKDKDELVIGFETLDSESPWSQAFVSDVIAALEDRGYNYVYGDARQDTAKQISDVEDLCSQDIDILIMMPIEYTSGGSCLQVAKEAGIPAFLMGRTAEGDHGSDYVTYVGSDFITQGREVGEWLLENATEPLKIVEITGTTGSSAAIERTTGFVEAIEGSDNAEIIVSQNGDFVRATGQKVMENVIQSLGKDGFNAVYCHNDDMAIGAINAMKAAGIKPGEDVLVVAIDGQKEAIQAIIDGDMNMTYTSSALLGNAILDAVEAWLNGASLPQYSYVTDIAIDATNAKDSMDLGF